MRASSNQTRIGYHGFLRRGRTVGGSGGGGGGGGGVSDHTIRMSHIAAGRPYITFLAPAETNADAARRLHIHTFSDPAA